MLIQLAWKNIWRKKSRTLILIFAIAFGLSGALFVITFSEGLIEQRNNDEIMYNYSHIQIFTPNFEQNQRLKDTIPNIAFIKKVLDTAKFVKFYSVRLRFLGFLSTPYQQLPCQINGIDPLVDSKVSNLANYLLDSTHKYVVPNTNSIVVSSILAQNLGLAYYIIDSITLSTLEKFNFTKKIVEKIKILGGVRFENKKEFSDSLKRYLTTEEFEKYSLLIFNKSVKFKLGKKILLRVSDINGNIIEETFKLTGIYQTNNMMFDNMNVFVDKMYLSNKVGLSPDKAHQIIILTKDYLKIDDFKKVLASKLKNVSVKTFMELDPMMMVKGYYLNTYYIIILGFILFALSFGIVNTVLMSVVERTKEIGMLMAIGMTKNKLFGLITYESIIITLLGGIIGMLLNTILYSIFAKTGINFGYFSESLKAYGVPSLIFPVLKFRIFVVTTIMVILTGFLSAIYPAFKALKLNPNEALRTDM